ncbi:MAG: cell wall-active antibiotics response protein [Melioribacteraceae bacterium]|nr:cell wall-active antibiotics response protein [Melioribacteraceae bacterium]
MMKTNSNVKTNTIIGIVIILIGGLILATNFNFFPGAYLKMIFKWQSILILIGIITYLNSGNKSLGVLLASIGILGFVPNFWALLLIGLGVYIIYKSKNKPPTEDINRDPEFNNPSEYINDISIFGGSRKNFQIANFRGGNITAIFGGSEIDLTNSSLCDGVSTLNIFFLFGGSNIRIPSNWNVFIELTPILGGFKDKRIVVADESSNNKKLVIKGFILFGGGDLNN